MLLQNKENIITNEQINNIIELLGDDFIPNKIIVYESKEDAKKYFLEDVKQITIGDMLNNLSATLDTIADSYMEINNNINLFVFMQGGFGKHSKQLYSIHRLINSLYQSKMYREGNKEDLEDEAINFATQFVNEHSEEISKIMGWKNEWEIEVE